MPRLPLTSCWLALTLAMTGACEDDESTASTFTEPEEPEEAPEPEPEPPGEAEPEAEPTMAAPTGPSAALIEATAGPLGEDGLPAVSEGRPVHLVQLEVTDHEVAITDEASRTRLNAELSSLPEDADRCRVTLAIETLVSVRCTWRRSPDHGGRDEAVFNYRVGVGGDVEYIEPWTLFHPGREPFEIVGRLLRRRTTPQFQVTLSRSGVVLSTRLDDEIELLPWRAVSPLIRADGPLGEALAAEGLPLAPIGTTMPAQPPTSMGVWHPDVVYLLGVWERLTPEQREVARLVDAGGPRGTGLLFPPAFDMDGYEAPPGGQIERGFYLEPMARMVLARTTVATPTLHEPGRRRAVRTQLDAGVTVVAAVGPVHGKASGIGRGRWAFVRGPSSAYGWVDGQNLEELTGEE